MSSHPNPAYFQASEPEPARLSFLRSLFSYAALFSLLCCVVSIAVIIVGVISDDYGIENVGIISIFFSCLMFVLSLSIRKLFL